MYSDPVEIHVVYLSRRTIRNLVNLCSTETVWNDKEKLSTAGLSAYDINRLSSIGVNMADTAKYSLRPHTRKDRDSEDDVVEKLKTIKLEKTEPVFRKRTKQEEEAARAEQQQRDLESVRRSLLKINARYKQGLDVGVWFALATILESYPHVIAHFDSVLQKLG